MAIAEVKFTLQFDGNYADENQLDFYDAAQALIGFQRSLALTTHLVLSHEVITHAPSLKGATIYATPPSVGSWKVTARVAVVAVPLYYAMTADRATPLGNLVSSAYDYVISESLGFHVDYEKTLGQQYEELRAREPGGRTLTQSSFDSVIEKCETAITEMHRPIVKSESANAAFISATIGRRPRLISELNEETYDHISFTKREQNLVTLIGTVSSYNINTFTGRAYVPEEKRPISFKLADGARDRATISLITRSLLMNAEERSLEASFLRFSVFKNTSRTGRLKSVLVVEVAKATAAERLR